MVVCAFKVSQFIWIITSHVIIRAFSADLKSNSLSLSLHELHICGHHIAYSLTDLKRSRDVCLISGSCFKDADNWVLTFYEFKNSIEWKIADVKCWIVLHISSCLFLFSSFGCCFFGRSIWFDLMVWFWSGRWVS